MEVEVGDPGGEVRARDVGASIAIEIGRPRVFLRSQARVTLPELLRREARPRGEAHVDVAVDERRDVRLAVSVEVAGPGIARGAPGRGGDGPHHLREAGTGREIHIDGAAV